MPSVADAEHLMISRVVYYPEEFGAITEAGITKNHFHDEEYGTVWDWLIQFWENHGKVPGRDALRMQFPNFTLAKVPEPLDFYIDRVNTQHRRYETNSMVKESLELLAEEKVDETRSLLSQRLMWLEHDTYRTTDVDLNISWKDRLVEYQVLVDMDGELLGIPTGFPTFDLITGGFQEEQFVVLIGPQKAGKSTILLRCARAANLAGRRVLFIGFEMTNREQGARYDGMVAGFDYTDLLYGRMNPKQRALLEKSWEAQEGLPEMHFVHDMSSATTLASVSAKIQQYRPDIVFIDGVYMMDSEIPDADPMDTRALTRLSRGLKRMAQVRKLPIVVSTQALDWKWSKKEGLTAKAAGYTSAFGQDCDYMFGIEPPDEEDSVAKMRLIAGRTAPRKLILVEFDWPHGRVEEQTMWNGEDEEEGEDEYARGA
jgi:energy-coupling factor transporter ATP-binding protein EcfA2